MTSQTKTYWQKPHGALRDEINRLYSGMRVKKPIEGLTRTGDVCAAAGPFILSNAVDLRPFYAMSPNLAIQLPSGSCCQLTKWSVGETDSE